MCWHVKSPSTLLLFSYTPRPQSHSFSSQSCKFHREIGSSPPCHVVGPLHYRRLQIQLIKALQASSEKKRDTRVLKQQCSHQTSVVPPKHGNRKWQYHQSACPRAARNLRFLQSRLGCMLAEPNRKWSLVSSGSQKAYKCSQTESSLSCHQSLSQRPVEQKVCLRMANTTVVSHIITKE